MSTTVEARLRWLSSREGGREALPMGPTYSTVARFDNQQETWPKEAWSLVIQFVDPPDKTRSHRVRVRFLADGPEELLRPPRTFELFEGQKVVARGRFIS
jgi:hypothetical protein